MNDHDVVVRWVIHAKEQAKLLLEHLEEGAPSAEFVYMHGSMISQIASAELSYPFHGRLEELREAPKARRIPLHSDVRGGVRREGPDGYVS